MSFVSDKNHLSAYLHPGLLASQPVINLGDSAVFCKYRCEIREDDVGDILKCILGVSFVQNVIKLEEF